MHSNPGDPSTVIADGDGRDFDEAMTAPMTRIYVEVDYATGTGCVEVNKSCTDQTQTDCNPPNSIENAFNSYVRSDGSVHIDFAIGNSLNSDTPVFNNFKISADMDILPIPDNQVCILGSASRYPSIEAYQDTHTSIRTVFQLEQSEWGPYALGAPDRLLPACETTEAPPYGPPGDPA